MCCSGVDNLHLNDATGGRCADGCVSRRKTPSSLVGGQTAAVPRRCRRHLVARAALVATDVPRSPSRSPGTPPASTTPAAAPSRRRGTPQSQSVDEGIGEELEVGQEVHVVDEGSVAEGLLVARPVEGHQVDDRVRQKVEGQGRQKDDRRDERLALVLDVLVVAELQQAHL